MSPPHTSDEVRNRRIFRKYASGGSILVTKNKGAENCNHRRR
ncbi:hypothetical protein HMPREF1989_01707 [Porphyromonas gingivalis F0566]|nr:hypothetical protein HMPREF1989_01707 [Porphyromonas gingivalis F0566]